MRALQLLILIYNVNIQVPLQTTEIHGSIRFCRYQLKVGEVRTEGDTFFFTHTKITAQSWRRELCTSKRLKNTI